ncbi:gluconokinase [Nocardiopsis terrae]|uniref:Gluconokinase n=1 Tax=Nocardiopsis terrae TaxID=372655 RepID=A0ABR9HCE8_9ACTN|nr:gluconokinase [Nocardiopsis terrae]MBE1456710.1 gluconokinase [Nocardiopsis terrae]GHC75453.1 gluconokinase [Nocardiopsis terrae]
MHFVFMGVSGSGKTSVAERVAEQLGLPFAEADDFHPEANITKMSSGVPLADRDRWPWLRELAGWIAGHEERGEATAMACSALKRTYRDVLRTGAPGVSFLHLHGPTEVIWERIGAREDHFMPPALLRSQMEALQRLGPDEAGVELDVRGDLDSLVAQALEYVSGRLRAPQV